jgi:hypothetical protein
MHFSHLFFDHYRFLFFACSTIRKVAPHGRHSTACRPAGRPGPTLEVGNIIKCRIERTKLCCATEDEHARGLFARRTNYSRTSARASARPGRPHHVLDRRQRAQASRPGTPSAAHPGRPAGRRRTSSTRRAWSPARHARACVAITRRPGF